MTQEIHQLLVNMVDPPKFAARLNPDDPDIIGLAHSIKRLGLLQPIIVKVVDDRFEVVAGHRRWLAHKMLSAIYIPALIQEVPAADFEAIKAVENLMSKALTPLEEARQVAAIMHDHELAPAEVAEMISKTESWVKSRLALLSWPDDFLEALQAEKIPIVVGRYLMQVTDEVYRSYLLHQAVKNGITGYTALAWLQHWRSTEEPLPSEELPEGDAPASAPQRIQVQMPCFRCERMTSIEHLVITRICTNCYNELTGKG